MLSAKQGHEMVLDGNELDRIVYDAIRNRSSSALTREEIAQLVLDHIKLHISEYIMPSIERLRGKDQIIEDRDDSRGRPYTYNVSPIKRRF